MALSSSHFAILNIPYTKISSFPFPPDLNLVPIRHSLTPPCSHLYHHTGTYNIRTHKVCLQWHPQSGLRVQVVLGLGGLHSLVLRASSITKEIVNHKNTKVLTGCFAKTV